MLFEYQRELRAPAIAPAEVNKPVVCTHNLTGKAQTYAGTLAFGGEKRNEYLLLAFRRYRGAVVADMYQGLLRAVYFRAYAYVFRTCLNGILDKIY